MKRLYQFADMGLGSAIFKTIMKNERLGNKRPRIQDTYYNNEKGIVNALGLPGSGTHKFSKNLNDSILWNYDCPIGIYWWRFKFRICRKY